MKTITIPRPQFVLGVLALVGACMAPLAQADSFVFQNSNNLGLGDGVTSACGYWGCTTGTQVVGMQGPAAEVFVPEIDILAGTGALTLVGFGLALAGERRRRV